MIPRSITPDRESEMDPNGDEWYRTTMSAEWGDRVSHLESGDQVRWGDRDAWSDVRKDGNKIIAIGPRGGEYWLTDHHNQYGDTRPPKFSIGGDITDLIDRRIPADRVVEGDR